MRRHYGLCKEHVCTTKTKRIWLCSSFCQKPKLLCGPLCCSLSGMVVWWWSYVNPSWCPLGQFSTIKTCPYKAIAESSPLGRQANVPLCWPTYSLAQSAVGGHDKEEKRGSNTLHIFEDTMHQLSLGTDSGTHKQQQQQAQKGTGGGQ